MAWNYLKGLIEEVGARRAGTEGESKAREWILHKCQELDLRTETHNFKFIGADYYAPLRVSTLLIILFIIVALSRDIHPTIIVLAATLFLFFELRIMNKVELHLAKAESANILASFGASPMEALMNKEKPVVMIAAHYDTARTIPKISKTVEKYLRSLLPLFLIVYVLFMAVEITRAIFYGIIWMTMISSGSIAWLDPMWKNFLWPLFLIMLAPFVVVYLATAIYSFATRESRPDSIGADDDATGIAVALAVMKRLQKEPLNKLDVVTAFWGVEEKGLFGSRQFVRSHGKKINKSRLFVINLDCLGVGNTFSVLTGQGILFRKKADLTLVKLLRDVCVEKGEQWKYYWETLITGGSSDHAEWIENGFKAVSLIRENYKPLTLAARVAAKMLFVPYQTQFEIEHVHTTKDTLDIIEKEKLERTVDIVHEIIHRINHQS